MLQNDDARAMHAANVGNRCVRFDGTDEKLKIRQINKNTPN